MSFRIVLGVTVIGLACLNGLASADDWADSQEVRNRLSQLRARSVKAGTNPPLVLDTVAQPSEPIKKAVTPWRSVTYDSIGPVEPPKNGSVKKQDRKIEVAEADKLGYQLNNPAMRDKVLELYRRPDIVVEQYVIGQ